MTFVDVGRRRIAGGRAVRELERLIGRVWRRMRFQRFLTALVWCWGAALSVVAVALAIEKAGGRALPGPAWLPLAIAGGIGLVAAMLIALLEGPSRFDAAVAIDRAFHLNERLSTALTLPAELRETPAAQALLADAILHVSALDLDSEFGPTLPRRAWVPLIPAALAVALLFVPAEWVQQKARARSAEEVDPKVVVEQSRALGKRIAAQRKELEQGKLAEAEELLAKIEKAAGDLAKTPPGQKAKVLVELNKLTDAVKERQKQLGSPEQIHRQLQQLKELASSGPADDFAKDLAKGDFQKAADELKKLQGQLTSFQSTEAEKMALKEQLGEMVKQLEKLANFDERRKQLEEARKNGGLSEEQFQREMAKLDERAKSMKPLQQLASKLGQAQQALEKGGLQEAAKALGQCQQQCEAMAKQLEELQSLDGALADLQDAKNGLNGETMSQKGESLAGMGMNPRNGQNNSQGLGRGRGQNDRPEAPDPTSMYNSKVELEHRKGKALLQGLTNSSKSVKGQSVIDIQTELATTEGLSAEALTNQKIPKNVEKHIRGYFDQINKGR